jgi:allantoate deiminase
MTERDTARAARVVARCREIARCTEIAGETTRRFLTAPMHQVHTLLRGWMEAAGMSVRVDAIGNMRGVRAGLRPDAPRLLIGSHLDTVPNAGAFDGILGVVLGIALIDELRGEPLPFAIEVIGFSEEEGVRFSKPFLGSLALIGGLDAAALNRTDCDGITIAEAITAFGLDPSALDDAALDRQSFAYIELHIEQGPVLESEDRALGVVAAIAGQSRLRFVFSGQSNHAGTTPMALRHDALAAAAHWMVEVEQYARSHAGLVATVGQIDVQPGAGNVIPGTAIVSLDLRHAVDETRHTAVAALLQHAEFAAALRGVHVVATRLMDQPAIAMNARLVGLLQRAAAEAGFAAGTMVSGAGHDAMILAPHCPSAMLFLRSPGGLSHHPDESVLVGDVEAALATSLAFLRLLRDDPDSVSSGNGGMHA